MSMIGNCLAKLVKTGMITPGAAKAAQAIHEGAQLNLSGAVPATHADAMAALEAAQIMAESARQRKAALARDAIARKTASDRMAAHPKSMAAGLNAMLTPDIHEADGGINVESLGRYREAVLLNKADKLVNTFNSKFAGLKHNWLGMKDVIRERFDQMTGNGAAKAASDAFQEAVDEGVRLAERAGKVFRSQMERDTWRMPQFWESYRIRKFSPLNAAGEHTPDAVLKDWYAEIDNGGLKIVDPDTGIEATATRIPVILNDAWKHMMLNQQQGAVTSPFNPKVRVFRFQNADSFMRLMDKYGMGEKGYYPALTAHLKGMAHESALMEVFGPNYYSVFREAQQKAFEQEGIRGRSYSLLRLFDSAKAAERTFKMLTGELNVIESEALAGFFGGLRNIATATNLKSAVVTAVPGDSVTAFLAAKHNGIPAANLVGEISRMIAEGGEGRKVSAARLQIEAHAAIDALQNAVRFGGETNPRALTGRLAELVIRGQGLSAWTGFIKQAYSRAFLGFVADQSGKSFDQVDDAFRQFLTKHKFTPDEWDKLRAAPLLELDNGATYFSTQGLGDEKLGERFMSAMIDERSYAVMEPGARVRGLITGNARRGTMAGELFRSAAMYKSFAIMILLTHGMRSLATGSIGQRAWRLGKFLSLMTLAGAAATQAKALLEGKDPRDMSDPLFWFDSFVTGGGSGIYGDLLKQGVDPRYENKLSDLLGGPPVQLLNQTSELTIGNVRDLIAGKSTHAGRDLARYVRAWTPGTWYTRLAADRLLFDEMNAQLDPDYRDAWRRQEKRLMENTGQRFFWRPGETTPGRAPDLGAALP